MLKIRRLRHNGPTWPDHLHGRACMRPTDTCSPTHNLRAFLQFLARSDNGIRRAERPQVSKIRLYIVQHLVTGTPIQSLRRRSFTNVRCCAERLYPTGFQHAQMVGHARSALVSTPIVHSVTPLDAGWCGTGGAAWSIALAQMLRMLRMLRIDNSRALSIMIS